MRTGRKSLAFRDLDHLFRRGVAPSGDGALLALYLAGGDESAFAAIVARHGPMVLGVCRRLLADPHDADDAFQATFLVLVRKGKGLRDADRLGPWLYGVATRVATKARSREARRRDRPGALLHDLPGRDGSPSEWVDVRPILDAELGRLSPRFRDVLVACLLEGATAEEAAARLALPLGTVKSRLARGREALRLRLEGRGVAPSVAVAALSETFASPVPAALTRATLGLGAASAAPSAGIVALTRGVAPTMLPKSTLLAASLVGGLTLAGMGLANRWNARATTQDAPANATAAPAPRPEDRAKAQAVTSRNMRTIALALYNYASANDRFPPPAVLAADGRPLLSWRVMILPFLEAPGAQALFQEFRLDEPWDSPHNRPLVDRMPEVFATPDAPAPKGHTRIRGIAGPGAFFEGTRDLALKEFTDGLSNTLMLVEAKADVAWTAPGEVPFDPDGPLPELLDDPRGHFVIRADGSTQFLPAGNAAFLAAFLRGAITRNGGEALEWPALPAAPPTAPRPAADAASSPPALEARLRAIEEKLDRVLQKLDTLPGPAPSGGRP